MTFDYSILTTIIYLLIFSLTFIILYFRSGNIKKAVLCGAFNYSVTAMAFMILLPIQLSSAGDESSVKINLFDSFALYGNDNWLACAAIGIIFSASGYLLYQKLRKSALTFAAAVTVLLLYSADGLLTNLCWNDYVKTIYVTEMAAFVIGTVVGFVAACIFCRANPDFIENVKKSNRVGGNDSYKDMNEL